MKKVEGQVNTDLLTRNEELRDVRDDLLEKYNAFDETQVRRLTKFLPDNVDNIRLLIEIDGVASNNGMVLRDVNFVDPAGANSSTVDGALAQSSDVGEIILSFVVVTDYGDFVSFIEDLEKSLRLVDIRRVNFSTNTQGLDEYSVELSTYWLKSDATL